MHSEQRSGKYELPLAGISPGSPGLLEHSFLEAFYLFSPTLHGDAVTVNILDSAVLGLLCSPEEGQVLGGGGTGKRPFQQQSQAEKQEEGRVGRGGWPSPLAPGVSVLAPLFTA